MSLHQRPYVSTPLQRVEERIDLQRALHGVAVLKEVLQSDRNRVFRLVTGGTGAVIAKKIEKEESGARLRMR